MGAGKVPLQDLVPGFVMRSERTFTREDVERFAVVSRDEGEHHLEPDSEGRIIVHGLLTATLATELGGRMNYLSRTMDYVFLAPVYVGDTITCVGEVLTREEKPGRVRLSFSTVFTNQHGERVLEGTSKGAVLLSGGRPEA